MMWTPRNSPEAFERVKARRSAERTYSQPARVPKISGNAANSLISHLRRLDDFRMRSLVKSGRKIIG